MNVKVNVFKIVNRNALMKHDRHDGMPEEVIKNDKNEVKIMTHFLISRHKIDVFENSFFHRLHEKAKCYV